MVVGSSVLFNIRRVQVVTLAAIHRLPTIYYDRISVEVGGLMSYGASIADAMRQGGVYVGRVLKGEKPGNLPVIQAGKFEFVINLQTAKSLRIAVPASMLAQRRRGDRIRCCLLRRVGTLLMWWTAPASSNELP